jgi:hypothetical protein
MPIIGHETRTIAMALSGAERQARYIAKLKSQAAHADVLAARLAAIEAEQADARLARHEARHAIAPKKSRSKATTHAR